MTGYNLPPGCNVGDLPGCSKEDEFYEKEYEKIMVDNAVIDELITENLEVLRDYIVYLEPFRTLIDDEIKKLYEDNKRHTIGKNGYNTIISRGLG